MKLFSKIVLLTAFSLQLNAQTYFNKLYDYDYGDTLANHATTSIALDSGNFLIAGNKFLPNYSALHYFKINSNGDTLFNKRYSKNNCAYYTSIGNSLIKCHDGNFVHCGSYYDSLGNASVLLVKLNGNGDTLWTKTYGGANFDNANMVCQTPDSGLVLMGTTQSFGIGSASNFYLIRVNKNGALQWQQAYGTTANEECSSGQITLDGGYIMAGHRTNVLYVIKTDSSGALEWQQTYTGTKNYGFIKQLADSSYILTGAKNVAGFGDQACMLKLNKNGGVIWQNTYGESGTGLDLFFTHAIILPDHSIVIGGTTMLGSIPIGMLTKTDSAGNQQWLRTYYANASFDNYVYDLKQTSDNGFLLTGSGGIASQDAWIVKVDSAGCEIANCNVGINELNTQILKINIYPNPANDKITITINDGQLTEYEIKIINVLGQIQSIEPNNKIIDVSKLSSGIYFVSATSKDGKYRLSEKFVKK